MNAKKPTVAMPPALMPGDLFVAECGSLLGRTISGVEKWKDAEGDPQWSHAGIIVSEAGETFEALWTIRNGDMSAYAGLRVMIARYKKMDRQRFRDAYKAVAKAHRNEIYPLWRLPLFFLGLARSLGSRLQRAAGGVQSLRLPGRRDFRIRQLARLRSRHARGHLRAMGGF